MVLEHIFPEDWIEKKGRYAFVLGVAYSVIGIIIASLLFPSDPALVAVAFTSLLLLPSMYKIFTIEERQERRLRMKRGFSLKSMWHAEHDVVRVYISLFIGILLVYSAAAMVLPSFQTNNLFREQIEIRYGEGFSGGAVGGGMAVSGGATGAVVSSVEDAVASPTFKSLLKNNFLVLMACFVVAFLAGDGAIFLIVWNASVWGTLFGLTARNAALASGESALMLFGLIMLIVLPHVILESLSYIVAAIAGAVVSKGVVAEGFFSKKFGTVFNFNYYLIAFALLFLLLGALAETFVLENATAYQKIIELSFMAFS